MVLTEEQKARYSRNILLPEIQEQGQEKLLSAKVLIVGVGGLGCSVAFYLAASGVGTLYLSDNELVELSNLQRQILYTTDDIGKLKTTAAKQRLHALNPEINVIPIAGLSILPLPKDFAQALQAAAVIVDCSDNFATRFALNKLCVEYKKPLVSGSAIGWNGQVATFYVNEANNPCYTCLYPEEDAINDQQPSCAETGVISPIVGIIGSMQGVAVIKALLQQSSEQHLLRFDGKLMRWSNSKISKDSACKVCSLS